MSASPMARQATESRSIPLKKTYEHESDLPAHYSSTPGGTLYSTTPGGTKIVYEKAFLMNLRNSPISKTPPTYGIPDSLARGKPNDYGIPRKRGANPVHRNNAVRADDEDQFHMDI